MGDNFEEFCGDVFWNETLLVDNSWPQFTVCFLQTIVVWIPCAFLWLLLPQYVISIKREKTDSFQLTLLNGSKLVTCLCLVALHLTQLIKRSEDGDALSQDKAAYLGHALWMASFLLMAFMTQYERLNGVQGLGVPFFFWLLTSLCNAIPFYHMLKMGEDDDLMFITEIIIYSLQLLSLLLTFFTDDFSKNGYTIAEKPACPETKSSFPSFLTFFWMTRLIVTGFKRDLSENDLWQPTRPERSDSVVPTFFKLWQEEEDRCRPRARNRGGGWFQSVLNSIKDVPGPNSSKEGGMKETLTERTPLYIPPGDSRQGKGKRPSLLRVVCKMFWWDIVVCLVFKVASDVIFLFSPFFLKLLLDFVVANEPGREWQGYVIALGLFLTTSLKAIFFGHSLFGATRVGIRIKAVLVAAIFKKVLTMNNATRNSTTTGKIVNLMSVDAQQIMERMDGIFFGLTTPVQVIVAVVLLYQVLGWAVFVGIGVLAFQVPLNAMLARKQKTYREQNLRFKDARVKLFGEILNAVKVIKLYAWEQSFRDKIRDIRKKELDVMLKMVNLNAVMGLVWDMAPFLVTLTTFVAFVLSDRTNQMTPADAFVSLAYFNILRAPLNTFATMIVTSIQSFVSIERINQFVVGEDLDPNSVNHDYSSEHVISIKGGTFAWTRDSKPCLTNINLDVSEGKLVAVVGPVGCGKSSLISAILGEMEKLRGTASTWGSVAYVPQQAWIQNASVRDNILFGKPYIRTKYTAAIKQCQLERDLELLPAGDMTEIGEKGINLSGGQKQRVSLARALYSENDVFLLDDPLSAVDSHVGKALFKNVLGPGGLLKNKTRVLVTHGIHWLPSVDEIVVMQDGKISERGSYETLVASNGPFAQSLKTYLTEVADDPEEDPEMAAIEKEMLEHLDSVSIETPKTSSHDDLSSSFSSGRPRRRKRDKQEVSLSHSQSVMSSNTSMKIREANKEAGRLVTIETVETGKVKAKVFWQYITAAGVPYLALAFLFYVSFQASSVGSSFWLKAWTSDSALVNVSSANFDEDNDYYLLVYGLYGVAQALCLIAFNWLYWRRMVYAAKEIHAKLANRLLRYPTSFFDTTPIGRILNRVSRDVDTVDSTLPNHVRGILVYSSLVLVTIVVIMVVTPVTGAVLFPVILIYYLCQKFFVPTSRQLKRIESVTRTPLYVLLFETLTGSASVRAYGATARFREQAKNIVDHNQVFFFATHASVRWLQWNLDFLSSLVIFAAALFEVVSVSSSSDPGNAGLSVSYALQLSGTLIWMTREATEFETHIVSVERLKEYSELPTEADWIIPSMRPPTGWPSKGEVSFVDYQTRYREGLDLVLKGITFTIAAGEKVGVVGRTGAGKTSLTLSLFRLIEAAGGSIMIDGVDIASVGLHDVRSHLTILPQEPVLFSGTLRFNLDPFDEYPEVQLWTALERAHLRGALDNIPEGLDFDCGEEGSNLSVGQRQLVCLARALLRKTSILVLDEATAAVDMETDALIQSTIRTAFNTCTVITIAHRLNTIVDYDRILVMDAGQVKEFASPKDLLSDKQSAFYSMAKDAGIV